MMWLPRALALLLVATSVSPAFAARKALNGDVRLKLEVARDGRTTWTGVVSGASKRFGRSYKAENYYETISDSLLHAIQSLAADPGFLDALRK